MQNHDLRPTPPFPTPAQKELLTDSPVFCMAPWTHLHVWPDGKAFSCCVTPMDMPLGTTQGASLAQIWNSERQRELRLNMLSGKPSPGCTRCYEIEDSGGESYRHGINRSYGHHFPLVQETQPDGTVQTLNLALMDFRFSNLCNFKCRTCGPQLSSGWHGDIKALGRPVTGSPVIAISEHSPHVWEELVGHLERVESIYFAGGEPMLMREHWDVLDWLIAHGRTEVRLRYNTNFSSLGHGRHDAVERWRHFPNVTVCASLDGKGARGEYLRKGQRWDRTERNRERLRREAPHVKFLLHPTISLMNILHIPDFHRDWAERGLIGWSDISLNLLLSPEYYRAAKIAQGTRTRKNRGPPRLSARAYVHQRQRMRMV